MLTKSEAAVMNEVYSRCKGKSSVLVCPTDLLNGIKGKRINSSRLEKMLIALSQDGYLDMIYSDRHGETVYCLSLTEKGNAYGRERKVFKRNLVFRLALSVTFAVISFLIGLILKTVF